MNIFDDDSYQSNEMLECTVQKFVDASLSGLEGTARGSDVDMAWSGVLREGNGPDRNKFDF